MIRIAINLFDAQECRKHRNLEKYDSLIKACLQQDVLLSILTWAPFKIQERSASGDRGQVITDSSLR